MTRVHPLYATWNGIKYRCYQKNHKSYPYYGARGITMCDEWRNDFRAFALAVGERPRGATLDRIDNDKGYEPGNVKWSTRVEQLANSRCQIRPKLIAFDGMELPLSQWASRLGISDQLLSIRIKRGWSIERALTQPVRENMR